MEEEVQEVVEIPLAPQPHQSQGGSTELPCATERRSSDLIARSLG